MLTTSTASALIRGKREPAEQSASQAWGPWHVVPRARGFHVSRESRDGQRHETLKNEVRKTKIFRVEHNARQAATLANEASA